MYRKTCEWCGGKGECIWCNNVGDRVVQEFPSDHKARAFELFEMVAIVLQNARSCVEKSQMTQALYLYYKARAYLYDARVHYRIWRRSFGVDK